MLNFNKEKKEKIPHDPEKKPKDLPTKPSENTKTAKDNFISEITAQIISETKDGIFGIVKSEAEKLFSEFNSSFSKTTSVFDRKIKIIQEDIKKSFDENDSIHTEIKKNVGNIKPILESIIKDSAKKSSSFQESALNTFAILNSKLEIIDSILAKKNIIENDTAEKIGSFDKKVEEYSLPIRNQIKKLEEEILKLSKGTYEYGASLQIAANGKVLGAPGSINFKNGTNTTVTITPNATTGSFDIQVNSTGGTTSPLTTKGDIFGYSTTNDRIPVGADGYVLTADSTNPLGVSWQISGGGTVAGPNGAVQFNNMGVPGGVNNLFWDNVNLELGVNNPSPQASVDTLAVGVLQNISFSYSVGGDNNGYPFNNMSYGYLVYAENSSIPLFSQGFDIGSSQPDPTRYDPTGGSAGFNTGESGYVASGYDFSYTVWALYDGNTQQSLDSITTNDTGSDPNDGSSYGVDVSWTAPALGSPSGYLVQCNGGNPNSGLYQIVSGTSFSDTNSGWGGAPSLVPIVYQITLNYMSGGGSPDTYVIYNYSQNTYTTTNSTSVTDNNYSWVGGSPTVTPTSPLEALISRGTTQLVIGGGNLGTFGVTPVPQQNNTDAVTALVNYGLLNNPTPIGVVDGGTGLNNFVGNQVLYGNPFGGGIAQSENLYFDGNNLGVGLSGVDAQTTFDMKGDFTLRLGISDSTPGVLNNYNVQGISVLYLSGASGVTGFANNNANVREKFLYVYNMVGSPMTIYNNNSGSTLLNQITTGTGGNIILPNQGILVLQYNYGNGKWMIISRGDITQIANTWASTQTFNGGVQYIYVAKTAAYTILTTDHTINCTANTFTVTLPTAVGITGQVFVIKNSGTGVITVKGNGSQTIDGSNTQSLPTQYTSIMVQSNGANWIIIA